MRLRRTPRQTACSVARRAPSMAACSAARRRSINTLGRPLRTTFTLQTWSTRRAARWYPSHGRSRARPMSRIFRASCRAAAGQGRGRCHRAQLRTHARASVSVRPLSGLTGLSTQAGAAVRDDQPRVPFPDPISAPRFLSPGIVSSCDCASCCSSTYGIIPPAMK